MTGSFPLHSVDATLSFSEAASVRWDAIIVGGGPAGAAAAVRLASGDRRVLLLDRSPMPRPKVCGCCLSDVATAELAAISLPVEQLGAVRRSRVRLVAAGCESTLAVAGWTVSRERLDAAIVRRAIAAGASWLPATRVSAVEEHENGVVISARDAFGTRLRLAAVHAVVAAGLGGVRIVSEGMRVPRAVCRRGSRIGVGGTLPPNVVALSADELVMRVAAEGYCGLVRLEDGRLDVAAAIDAAAVGRCGSAVEAVARLCGGVLPSGFDGVDNLFAATPALTHATGTVAGRWRRIHRIGDAAAYVEPFTGEGIGWALVSARSLAEALLAHDPDESTATAARIARDHERAIAARLAGPRRRCLRVAAAIRRPGIVAATMAATRLAPAAAAWASPLVIGGVRAVSGSLR